MQKLGATFCLQIGGASEQRSDLLRQQVLPHMQLPQVSWHVRMALMRWLAGR